MSLHINKPATSKSGFTIVELLIVIIVIAILAAIVIVAYNGVRRQAIDSRLKSDLSQAKTKLIALRTTGDTGSYPANFTDTGIPTTSGDGGTTYMYNVSPDGKIFCLQAVSSGRTHFVTNDGSEPAPGECNGTTGVPTDGNFTDEIDLSGNETHSVTYNNGSGVGQVFSVEVPAGINYLNVNTQGGTKTGTFGANLRIKQGSAPTGGSNDCSQINAFGNLEGCFMSNPTAGTWYVEVFPYNASDTYANVTLTIDWGYWEGEYTEPLTLSAGEWSRRYYTVNVPSGTDYLSVWTANGTDTGYGANVAIKAGSRPGNVGSPSNGADCNSSSNTDNFDNCFITNPTPGIWHIVVYSTGSAATAGTYTNANFQVDMGEFEGAYTGPVNISSGPWTRKIYSHTVPSGADYLAVKTYGGTETGYGANIATKYNAIPGSTTAADANADCTGKDTSNSEVCYIYNPTPGTWYSSVYSGWFYAGTFDNTTVDISTGNWSGAYTGPVTLNGGYWYRTMYTINVPAGKTSLTATLSGGTETGYGANVAMKYNTPPGASGATAYLDADCYSIGTTNAESCTINNPTAGTWYVEVFSGGAGIMSSSTFQNVTLNVSTAP